MLLLYKYVIYILYITPGEEDVKKMSCTVVVVGHNVGKSMLLDRYVDGSYTHQLKTVGVDFKSKTEELISSGKTFTLICKLQIWELGSDDKFKRVVDSYYNYADVFLLCFDITNKESFNKAKNKYLRLIQDNGKRNTPIMLVGLKSDLKESRVVSQDDAKQFVRDTANLYGYMECSANTGENVKEIFKSVALKKFGNYIEKRAEKEQAEKEQAEKEQAELKHKMKFLLTGTSPIVALCLVLPSMMKNSQYVEILSKLITGGKFSVAVASALSVIAVIGAFCLVNDIYKVIAKGKASKLTPSVKFLISGLSATALTLTLGLALATGIAMLFSSYATVTLGYEMCKWARGKYRNKTVVKDIEVIPIPLNKQIDISPLS